MCDNVIKFILRFIQPGMWYIVELCYAFVSSFHFSHLFEVHRKSYSKSHVVHKTRLQHSRGHEKNGDKLSTWVSLFEAEYGHLFTLYFTQKTNYLHKPYTKCHSHEIFWLLGLWISELGKFLLKAQAHHLAPREIANYTALHAIC